ncbi:hypothetical protein AAG570_010326 [Ranatra chinensis]|uniref:Uncharacterized protein n=1 Tax=Ranatra chinensis TaxID=642074 RepID=A0ABD0YM82_9HEMI
MEQIYTVKVKCRPNPGLAYPSERAYSSSTVGGLALAHLFLAAIGFTLCALGYATHCEYIGGVVMIIGALSAGLVGLLACKRWYVDRNIRWFLVVSVLSCLCSTVSAVLSCVVLIRQAHPVHWPGPDLNDTSTFNVTAVEAEPGEVEPVVEFRREIYVHIFLASVVECVWSVLSVKIAWKGVKNGLKKMRKKKNNNNYPQKRCQGVGQESRPDILENIRKSSLDPKFGNYSDVVKELCRLQRTSDRLVVGALYPVESEHPQLPLPESHLEYRQRIEKFLQSGSEQCDSGIS